MKRWFKTSRSLNKTQIVYSNASQAKPSILSVLKSRFEMLAPLWQLIQLSRGRKLPVKLTVLINEENKRRPNIIKTSPLTYDLYGPRRNQTSHYSIQTHEISLKKARMSLFLLSTSGLGELQMSQRTQPKNKFPLQKTDMNGLILQTTFTDFIVFLKIKRKLEKKL